MARPRVFVSSTFYDLKYIRSSLETFIDSLGFDAVLFEKGDISFHPDMALDESCYREAAGADIFVLIIGGRYGSASSHQAMGAVSKSPDDYESITKREFESAQAGDVPTFILVESAVSAEYQTYRKNKSNESIQYAHVDSALVFRLLESIFEKSRNNPVFNFDRASQIEAWLREQWSGLFRELLKSRSQQRQLSSLNIQVQELNSVTETLKTYLEAVLNKVSPDKSDELIFDQEARLKRKQKEIELSANDFYRYLMTVGIEKGAAYEVLEKPTTADEVVSEVARLEKDDPNGKSLFEMHAQAQNDYNLAREIIGLSPIDFSNSSLPGVVSKSAEASMHLRRDRAVLRIEEDFRVPATEHVKQRPVFAKRRTKDGDGK